MSHDRSLRIRSSDARVGQEVTLFVFPAAEGPSDRTANPSGQNRRGTIATIEPHDFTCVDAHETWTVPGIRVMFEDGTTWDGVGHAFATWHSGPQPALADVKAAEAAEADNLAQVEESNAAYDAEGFFADYDMHPDVDEDGQPSICVHTPFEGPGDTDAVPFLISPEQAEAFALRLLREASVARLVRSGALHLNNTED